MKDENLITYLNDHLAGSVAGIELAYDCLSRNKGSKLGLFLDKMISKLEYEQSKVKQCLTILDASQSTLKKVAGWTLEKASRLKFGTMLTGGYSDLSRLQELEALIMGVNAQIGMWRIFEAHCSDDPRFREMNFSAYRDDMSHLLKELESFHLEAAGAAFIPWEQSSTGS